MLQRNFKEPGKCLVAAEEVEFVLGGGRKKYVYWSCVFKADYACFGILIEGVE